jgi:hypothetical protein
MPELHELAVDNRSCLSSTLPLVRGGGFTSESQAELGPRLPGLPACALEVLFHRIDDRSWIELFAEGREECATSGESKATGEGLSIRALNWLSVDACCFMSVPNTMLITRSRITLRTYAAKGLQRSDKRVAGNTELR